MGSQMFFIYCENEHKCLLSALKLGVGFDTGQPCLGVVPICAFIEMKYPSGWCYKAPLRSDNT